MDTVSELMTPNPQVVRADTPLVVAARTMLRLGIRHLPVVDQAGALAGILTDAAVFARGGLVGAHEELWVAFEPADEGLTAGQVAVAAEVVAGEDEPLLPVLRRLLATTQDVVVVVDTAGHPVGVITEHDPVRLAQGVLPEGGSETVVASGVHAVRRDEPATRALELMRTHGIRHVVVTEGDGRLFGVLSYSDLVADGVGPERELSAGDVVRRGRLVVARGDGLREAAVTMARHKVGCLPLLDEAERPQAVVTRTDVIRALVAALEAEGR